MEAFVDAVRNHLPAPVNGNDGLMAVVIGLAAAKSVRENRPVSLTEIYSTAL
jgi:myo-inositol 2-dehydrogenase/D-chiro-inositol 1-dehydrogenase